jgi:hypothetical protein
MFLHLLIHVPVLMAWKLRAWTQESKEIEAIGFGIDQLWINMHSFPELVFPLIKWRLAEYGTCGSVSSLDTQQRGDGHPPWPSKVTLHPCILHSSLALRLLREVRKWVERKKRSNWRKTERYYLLSCPSSRVRVFVVATLLHPATYFLIRGLSS